MRAWTALTWPVLCGTGHRDLDADASLWLAERLLAAARWARDTCGTTTALCGMAIGADIIWGEAAVKAGLILGAYVPCPPHPSWPVDWRRRYDALLTVADPARSKTFATSYSPQAMTRRNDGMITDSSAVLCTWITGRRRGGTYQAIATAHRLHRPGVHFEPAHRTVAWGLPDLHTPGPQ
jgi:hypothetical protein